jgi:hypothetical protein
MQPKGHNPDSSDADRPDADRRGLLPQRLRAQRLTGALLDRPETVVRWLGAVQSQDYAGAKWAVAQRAQDCVDADVEAAFDSGAILRTHVLRPTWHFVAPADIRWLLRLTAPRVHAASATYYRKTGLDDATFRRSNGALAKALQGGRHRTRLELRAALHTAGVATDGLRLALLLMHAELDAVICSGPRRGKQFTYAALDERVPATPAPSHDESLTELARRYFSGHGPAQPQDLAWWSGLKVADAVTAIQMLGRELETVRVGAQAYWRAAPAPPVRRDRTPIVRLLPNYDEYLVAFRDHAPVFDPRLAGLLGRREGFLFNNVIVANGRVVGGWRRTLRKDEVVVEATLPTPLDDRDRAALDAEVLRYGRFLGLRAHLRTGAPQRRRSRHSSTLI